MTTNIDALTNSIDLLMKEEEGGDNFKVCGLKRIVLFIMITYYSSI